METKHGADRQYRERDVSEGLNSVETFDILSHTWSDIVVSEGLNSVETTYRAQSRIRKKRVSEGLNSVETRYTASGIFPHRDEFQKDLIVWKPFPQKYHWCSLFCVSEGLNSVETFYSTFVWSVY